ncbi:GNAT family N-acetyltransferase [Aurantibacter crassamenti]|uniref:GNAT family N-acetyltransferase n=1 Tax=Aurantibacter crassamenti TaxID=1837375 RepID=UPI0019394D0C|nr:GNAT family N-acetyltransferase [Aurantibacter crassamenti]MBM1107528.1 GNAT family N-acetyltransferase [Aurantibacter crassamenti]
MINIHQATIEDIQEVASLFDKYRIFYKQESNLEAAKDFLHERLTKNESIILIAVIDNKAVGFTQLYTSFSSVSLQSTYILNDLYVLDSHRKKGIGEALLNKAKELCKVNNFKGLALSTAIDNPAQQLYEKLNWQKDSGYFHYFWTAK